MHKDLFLNCNDKIDRCENKPNHLERKIPHNFWTILNKIDTVYGTACSRICKFVSSSIALRLIHKRCIFDLTDNFTYRIRLLKRKIFSRYILYLLQSYSKGYLRYLNVTVA